MMLNLIQAASAPHVHRFFKCTTAPVSLIEAVTQDRGPGCTRIGLAVDKPRHAIGQILPYIHHYSVGSGPFQHLHLLVQELCIVGRCMDERRLLTCATNGNVPSAASAGFLHC